MALATLIRRPPTSRYFDRLMNEVWGDFGLASLSLAGPGAFSARPRPSAPHGVAGRLCPQLEARELETAYRVSAEIPGVDAKDLEVTVDGGVLSIKGRRRYPEAESLSGEAASDVEKESEPQESFERRLRFPGEIAEGEVTATYRNGVLTVTVPKLAEAKPEIRTIPVETA